LMEFFFFFRCEFLWCIFFSLGGILFFRVGEVG